MFTPIGILTFVIILSILVLIHEFGHFIVAKKNNVFVEEFGFGIPPRIFGIKIGETLYSLNWLPFGGFVKVLGEEEHEIDGKKLPAELKNRTFVSKPARVKILILTAGVLSNFVLGWVIMSYLFTQGIPVPTKIVIESIANNSPAQQAGIQKKDVIKSITTPSDSKEITMSDEFVSLINNAKGTQVSMIVLRGGTQHVVTLTPRLNPPPGEGSLGIVLSQQFITKKYSWYQAPYYSLIESANITYQIIKELSKTVVSLIHLQKPNTEVAGFVGIAEITGQAVKAGNLAVLQLLGILSLNLAVINILPFPALDGGRLAFVLYETITKRKINPEIERRLNMTGFAILLSLIGLITLHDILKLFVK